LSKETDCMVLFFFQRPANTARWRIGKFAVLVVLCWSSEVHRHCAPADWVLVAVLEGGIWAAVAGAAAISIRRRFRHRHCRFRHRLGISVSTISLPSGAVKQLHEVVPERFNTWLLAAHRHFGQGFDDQAFVVADAAKEKGRVIHPFGKGFQFREHFTQGRKVKIVPGDLVAHVVAEISRSAV
jgi:hypothetical protein